MIRRGMKLPEININLTMKQIHDVLCPACQGKLIDLAAQEGSKNIAASEIKKMLEKQLRGEQHG